MPAFDKEGLGSRGVDLGLFKLGPIHHFYRKSTLNKVLAELEALGYGVAEFDCASWKSDKEQYADFMSKLDFGDYGGSTNYSGCVRDGLFDLEIAPAMGQAIVLYNLDKCPIEVKWLLGDLAQASRMHMLYGERLLTLILADEFPSGFDVLDKVGINSAERKPPPPRPWGNQTVTKKPTP